MTERIYESVNVNSFNVEDEDLADIGTKLGVLGEGLSAEQLKRFFEMDD